MKKLLLILVMLIGISTASFADESGLFSPVSERGGLLGRGPVRSENTEVNVENQRDNEVPVGAGSVLLISFAGAYALLKKNEQE